MQETFMYIFTFDSLDSIPASGFKVKAGVLQTAFLALRHFTFEYEFQPFFCQS